MIKTVTLETAKLLKEDGFIQDTYFHYEENPRILEERTDSELPFILFVNKSPGIGEIFAAPTTDELFEELPSTIWVQKEDKEYRLRLEKMNNGFMVEYGDKVRIYEQSLPEALAQMWLWLKKQGLL